MDGQHFLNLPPELHSYIFTNLKLSDIKPLAFTNKATNTMIKNNYILWQTKYDKEIESSIFEDRSIEYYMTCLKRKFLDRKSVLKCLKEIRQEIETDQTDITHIEQTFKSKDNIIHSSSDDQSVKIFKNYKLEHVLNGHHGGIWAFAVNKKFLVSGSTDRNVKIWNLENRMCLSTLTGHRSTVRCLKLTDDYIISGSRDSDIRIWNYSGTCLFTLKGHTESVRCMDANDNILVSGSYDGSVIVWDYRKGKGLCNLTQHDSRVYCVMVTENYTISGAQDSKLFVSNFKGKLVYTLKGHNNIVAWLALSRSFGREKYLFSSGADGWISKWDLDNGNLVYKIQLNTHITSMKIWNDLLVVSTNHLVNLYDAKNGKLIRNLLENALSVYGVSFKENSIVIGYKNTRNTTILVFDYRRA